jgi:homoserine/homoserine lactone efflux protein
MTIELWTVYVTAVVILCLTPGPNSLLAIANGARYGLRATVFSSLGCACGLVLLIALSLTGLGLVLSSSELIFTIIKWAGAAYLLFLGITLVRSKASLAGAAHFSGGESSLAASGKPTAAPVGNTKRIAKGRSRHSLWLQGFVVIVTNPKVLVFFAAFFPQFYDPAAAFGTQLFIFAGTFIFIEFTVELLLASMATTLLRRAASARATSRFNSLTGGLFICAGAYLMTLERP